jgi:hypothetical protein
MYIQLTKCTALASVHSGYSGKDILDLFPPPPPGRGGAFTPSVLADV